MGRTGPKRTYTRDDVRDIIATYGTEPWTTREIADELGSSTDTAHNRLDELHKLGEINKKPIRDTATLWWNDN